MRSPWATQLDRTPWINDGPDCYCCDCGKRLVWSSCPTCDTDHAVTAPRLPCGCPLDSGCNGYHSL